MGKEITFIVNDHPKTYAVGEGINWFIQFPGESSEVNLRLDRVLKFLFVWTCVLGVASAQTNAPVRVILFGDGTAAGFPREAAPDADRFEIVIQKLLAADTNLPPVEVINKAVGGDSVRALLAALPSRYSPDTASDFVFLRLGLKDFTEYWSKPAGTFESEFPKVYHEFLVRLRTDYPNAVITLETMIPFWDATTDKKVNDVLRAVAAAEGIPLLDTHARFVREIGLPNPHPLTMRCRELASIPANLRPLIPKNCLVDTGVYVIDNSLDAHFREVPGWFDDQHPNLAGYHVIADEIARYLAPWIRENAATRPSAQGASPIRVLLLGDSTVAGFPRQAAPDADRLETIIEKLLATETNLPPVEVINKGLGGDTVRDLLSARYDKDVASIPAGQIDFIFVRYGINDRSHFPQTFTNEFPTN